MIQYKENKSCVKISCEKDSSQINKFILFKNSFSKNFYVIPLIVFFFHLLIFPNQTFAQFSQQGINIFNGVSQFASNHSDEIRNTIIDDSGYIYTTGMISDSIGLHHFSTIKFDKNGNKIWQAIYNEGKFSKYAGLSCDNQSNVIVSGYIHGVTYDSALTLKYNKNGELLWAKTYIEDFGNCRSYSNLVDSLGNIFVSGSFQDVVHPYNANLLLKYSPNGQLQWVQRYSFYTTPNQWLQSRIIFDANKNIYLLGFNNISGTVRYIVLKYNNLGQQIWSKDILGVLILPYNINSMNIMTDGKSLIYLGLRAYSAGLYNNDYATIKLDTNGNHIWTYSYSAGQSSNDNPSDIAVDNFSNVIVTGNTGTVKYDSSGNTMWTLTTPMVNIVCDPNQNFYLSGTNSQNDILLQKYNSNGGVIWTRTFNGIGNGPDIGGKILFYDSSIIISGNSTNGYSQSKSTILKYKTDGQLAWANTMGNYSDEGNSVSLSKTSVYVAGNTLKDSSNRDFQIIKYNYNLQRQWERSYNGSGNGIDIPYEIEVDNSENIYVIGESYGGPNRKKDFITIKFNSAGDIQWTNSYNGQANSDDVASSILVDTVSNSLIVAGYSHEQIPNSDYLIIKYDLNGNELWRKNYNGSGNGNDEIKSAKSDNENNILVTGTSFNSNSNNDLVTLKLDHAGNQIWENSIDGSFDDKAASIATDRKNNIFVTGSSKNVNNNYDIVTVKYDSSGEQLWINTFNGSGSGDDLSSACCVDSSGNVYVFGSSSNSSQNFDYTVIKYDSTGEQKWVSSYNGIANGDDILIEAQIDGSGLLYTTGSSRNSNQNFDYCTVIFDSTGLQRSVYYYNNTIDKNDYAVDISVTPYPVTGGSQYIFVTGSSNGSGSLSDIATLRLGRYIVIVGIDEIEGIIPEEFRLYQNYPNPFNPNTIIRYSLIENGLATMKVFDALGKEIATLVNQNQNHGTYEVKFDCSNLSSGIYFYKLTTVNFNEVKRMVLLK